MVSTDTTSRVVEMFHIYLHTCISELEILLWV